MRRSIFVSLNKLMRQLLILLALNVVIISQAVAQKAVTGTVTDAATREALPGVSVRVTGTSVGVTTDLNGSYTINVSDKDTLEYSFIGYVKQAIPVNGQTTIDVVLQVSELDDVVIIGYGVRKKSHNTGAIAQIGGDNIAAIQANRVDDALAGKLSGVLIQNQDGSPGADPKIQIRAASSITGDANPLIVVDGYPISGSLATVNPNDIQSLEVLKDAASAAIYGSRGCKWSNFSDNQKRKIG